MQNNIFFNFLQCFFFYDIKPQMLTTQKTQKHPPNGLNPNQVVKMKFQIKSLSLPKIQQLKAPQIQLQGNQLQLRWRRQLRRQRPQLQRMRPNLLAIRKMILVKRPPLKPKCEQPENVRWFPLKLA